MLDIEGNDGIYMGGYRSSCHMPVAGVIHHPRDFRLITGDGSARKSDTEGSDQSCSLRTTLHSILIFEQLWQVSFGFGQDLLGPSHPTQV